MQRGKKLKSLIAAGLLMAATAATAAPAMAVEYSFSGMFRNYYDVSNVNVVRNEDVYGYMYLDNGAPTANVFETRLRTNFTMKFSEDLKLVTREEINYGFWGNSSYTAGRSSGGAIGSRGVNIETKRLYIDANFPTYNLNTKLGMQPFDDAYKGIFVSDDMPGFSISNTTKNLTTTIGAYRWNDGTLSTKPNTAYGKMTKDLISLDGKYEINKDVKVGAAYYFMSSDNITGTLPDGTATLPNWNNIYGLYNGNENITLHMFGINGEATMGPLTLDGFFVYQCGSNYLNKQHVSAFATNVGGRMKIGPGTLRSEFLFVSGGGNPNTPSSSNDNGFIDTGIYNGFYNNEMVILGRDKYAQINDNAIVYNVNNFNQGVIFGSFGYDLPITEKFKGSANMGFAAVAKDWGAPLIGNSTTNDPTNGSYGYKVNGPLAGGKHHSNYLGTEINAEVDYLLFPQLEIGLRGGYVFLGDYFKGTASNNTADPDNPFAMKVIATLTF